MEKKVTETIALQLNKLLGVKMAGSVNIRGPRQGLTFWFENYTRSNGPTFTIRPYGLKRHKVSVSFGSYAAPCIRHIQERATDDDYALARALLSQLNESYELSINDAQLQQDWTVAAELKISATRKVSDPRAQENIEETVHLIMAPLVAAIAELIGYEEEIIPQFVDSNIEGEIKKSLSSRRERSRRNRLLCLSVHGERCKICGFTTSKVYGKEITSIIEVHHIEPLADIQEPKPYNPKTDLIPLCPNCHRAIHKRIPPYHPEELGKIINYEPNDISTTH